MSKSRRATALIASLLATACAGEPVHDAAPNLADTQWAVEDIGGDGVVDNAQTTLNIEAGGRFNGTGGCNRYFGEAIFDAGSVEFGPIGSTRMACQDGILDQELRFFAALEASRFYRQDPVTGLLFFTDEDGNDLLRLRRLRKIEAADPPSSPAR
jgi:heat shock protein HslJ